MSRLGRIIPALLLLTAAWCQAAGRIEGTIRDGSQAVVPQTSIVCVAEDTGFRFQTHSDREGNYAVVVPDGAYNIIVRHPGFDSAARIGLLVPRAGTLRVDFELEPSSVSETVDVRDAAESFGFAESAATVLKPNALRALPRNDGAVTGLLSLVPGVLSTPASRGEAGQFSSAGGRPNTNQFSVDGLSANNAVAGAGWPSFLPGGRLPEMTALGTTHALSMLDAIQEVRLETQGEGAGAAQTPGANIIIHTRSGTNHFHGSFFINARPQALGANDWFTNRYGLGSDAPGLHEEGGSLGGPLGRADSDSPTFFFASAERLSLQEGYAWTTTVPSRLARVLSPNSVLSLLNEFPVPNGPDLTPGISQLIGKTSLPAGLKTGAVRIDRQLSAAVRSFLRYADTPSWSNSGLTQIALTEYRNRVAIFGLTRTRGSWIQDTRLGYSRNEAVSRWLNQPTGGAAFYSQNPSLAADFSNIVVGGAGTVSAGQSGRNLQNQWQASYNSAWETSRHQLRLGIEYLELQPVRNGPAESATVAFGTPTNIIYGPLVPIWITYSRPSANSTHLTRASAFVEDTWRMGSRMSLTAGIRASYPKPPSVRPGSSLYSIDDSVTPVLLTPIQDRQPLWIGPSMKYAPRVALAWRLPGRGDTVLRASWSLFQDLGSAAATDQLNGIPYRQLSTPDGGPGAVYDTSQLLPVQLAYGYARNLRLPTYQRWNVQLQHEWRHRDTLAVSYAGLVGTGELRREIVLNPTPEFGGVIFSSSNGSSRYHGLNVLYRRPLSSGVQASIGYTWSHSLDLNSSDSSVFVVSSTSNPSVDRGSSDFDVRHVLNAALTYATPTRGRGIAGRLASHWTLGTMFFARSGFPIDVLVSETLRGFAIANYRPTQFSGVPAWISNPAAPGGRELNRNAFGYPLPGLVPLGRNTLRGFGMWQSDVSAERAVWKGATREISFRADAFNITNSPRFSDPARYASNPMFGQSQSALNLMLGGGSPSSGQAPAFLTGAPRSIQTSLRFSF